MCFLYTTNKLLLIIIYECRYIITYYYYYTKCTCIQDTYEECFSRKRHCDTWSRDASKISFLPLSWSFKIFAVLIRMWSCAQKKSLSWTYTLKFLMHCPVRHTHITHYCPCQSLHHTRCPLASPCPIMLHWTPWCCFYKLSGHICRSLCREVQSCSVFLLQFLHWCVVCSQGKTNLQSFSSRLLSSESKIMMSYLVFLLMSQIVYGWWKKLTHQ